MARGSAEDPAVAFARRLLGGTTSAFGWGGRTRVVLCESGARQRWRAASTAPAFRVPRRVLRAAHALRHAVAPEGLESGPPSRFRDHLPVPYQDWTPVSVIIGTPGSRRTLVVRLVDASGWPTAALKIAFGADADAAIINEVEALSDPSTAPLAPQILWSGAIEGRAVVATCHIDGVPVSLGRRDAIEAASVLPVANRDAPHARALEHPWVRRVLASTGRSSDEVERLDGVWPMMRFHGDFAPWNLIRRPTGALVAIDWEASDAQGFPGVDLAHYALAVDMALGRTAPRAMIGRATARLTECLNIDETAAHVIVGLTAASVASLRRDEGAETAADEWTRIADAALLRLSSEKLHGGPFKARNGDPG